MISSGDIAEALPDMFLGRVILGNSERFDASVWRVQVKANVVVEGWTRPDV
jgi:hypothetical protein